MSLTRATLLKAAEAYVQDDAGRITHTDPGDFGVAMDRAIERYSHDRPCEIVATSSGDGSTTDFALPTGWVQDFSELRRVEHPFPPATGQREPNIVHDTNDPNEPAEVRIVQATSTDKKFRFMSITPETGTNNILWVFTGLHTVHVNTPASTTVRSSDEQALALLVAAEACEMVASKYAETKDATFSVDSVDYRSRSAEYAARGAKLRKLYLAHVCGDPDAETPPADGIVDWDATLAHGRDRLVHGRRRLV